MRGDGGVWISEEGVALDECRNAIVVIAILSTEVIIEEFCQVLVELALTETPVDVVSLTAKTGA